MKLISWNVNGLRACVQKGFLEQFERLDADFFCLQETKMQQGQLELALPGYLQYWNSAEKKGYSGTAVFTRHVPLSVFYGMGDPELDTEGRMITLEYPEFYLVTCYTPNAQRGLARIDFRLRWDAAFRAYLTKLDACKPVIICGDLNVAHQEIDLKNPGSNRGNAGFSDEERDSFSKTLAAGFTDTFRHLHPDVKGAYTWWSYMFNARQNNAGWRIDYFLVSDRIKDTVYKTPIYADILGSDHCPVGLELDVPCNGSIWQSEGKPEKAKTAGEKKADAKATGKLAVKVGALALAAVGLILGVARIQPAESLQTDPTVQTQPQLMQPTEQTEPPAEKKEPFQVTIGEEAPDLKLLDNPMFSYEVRVGSECWLLGRDFPRTESWNFWVWLKLNDTISGSEFANARCTIGIAEELCNSAMAAQGSGIVMNYCRFYREDGTPGGWLLMGRAARSTGLQVSVALQDEWRMQEFTVTPRFDKTQAQMMTTEALADYAMHLDAFKKATGGIAFYREMANSDPVLSELEKRTDAGEWIAILADRNPELQTKDYLKEVFPWTEETDLRGLSKPEAEALPMEKLVWLILRDEQLAEDLLNARKDDRAQIWLTEYYAVYPAMREFSGRLAVKGELLRYMCSYNGSRIQLLASALFTCPMDSASLPYETLQYESFLDKEAEYRLAAITAEQAGNMKTEELVVLVAQSHLEPNMLFFPTLDYYASSYLVSGVVSDSVLGYGSAGAYYRDFREKYPVFRELETREDAIGQMFAYCETAADAASCDRIKFLLKQPVYLVKMTDGQAKAFLEGLLTKKLPDLSTSMLAAYAMEYVMPLAWERIGTETKDYEKLTENYPIMKELESRSNCAGYILDVVSQLSGDPELLRQYVVFLLDQEPYRRSMTPNEEQRLASLLASLITAENAEQMTSVELAEKIVNLSGLRSYITGSTGYYESFFVSGYESCLKSYPVLAELAGRQDAVSALLEVAERPKQATESKLIMNILQMESYLQRMTEEEAYRYMKLGGTYLWKSKIEELTTNKLARICLSFNFLSARLSRAGTAGEAEEIYQRIITVYPALKELEDREDLVAELLFFCDPSNLSVLPIQRNNAILLLSLNRYYMRLTAEQQLKLASLLLESDAMRMEGRVLETDM